VNANNSLPSRAEGRTDRDERLAVVPVMPIDNNGVLAEIMARETKVVRGKGSISVDEAVMVREDGLVEADLFSRETAEILAEAAQACMELLEDDSLSLDVTDSLSDDLLSHLLDDEETLLDNLNSLCMADERLSRNNDGLRATRPVKVIDAVEVVKVRQGREATPVVEGLECAGDQIGTLDGQRSGRDTGDGGESRDSDYSDLSEHLG